jgi:recombination protein RecA
MARTAPAAPTGGYLDSLRSAADKQYGAGTMTMAVNAFSFIKHIPFGHLIGDLCTLGGLPEGRAAMFLGKEGAGKTTQAMRMVAQAQRKYPGYHALWIDAEQTFDPMWAASHGVDLDRLHLVSTVTGEDAADLMKTAVANAEELCILVLDSVNQLTPMKEYDESVGDVNVALRARLMGRLCSSLTSAQADRRNKGWLPVTQVFINQYRTTIGGMPRMDTKVIPGGIQLKHYCSTHIEFKAKVVQQRDETENTTPYVVEHVFIVKRSKGPSSLREGEYSVVVGADHPLPIGSYDEAGTILAQAKKIGLWTGAGKAQKFTMYPEVFGKMDEGIDWLEDHPAEAMDIKRLIISYHRQRVGMTRLPVDDYLLRWP